MKIKCNSDDQLSLNKTIVIPSMIIFVRAVFHENNQKLKLQNQMDNKN